MGKEASKKRKYRDMPPFFARRYAAWLILLIGSVMTFGTFWNVRESEQRAFERHVTIQANNLSNHIQAAMKARVSAFERLTDRYVMSGGTNKEEWHADTYNYVKDQPGYQAIELVGANYRVKWVEPLAGNEAAINLDLGSEPKRRRALEQAKRKNEVYFTRAVDLVQGGTGFLLFDPIFIEGEFHGFMLGVFKFEPLFNDLLKNWDTTHYSLELYDSDTKLYQNDAREVKNITPTDITLNEYGVEWKLHIAGTQKLVDDYGSLLPLVNLIAGLFISLSLAWTAVVYRRSWLESERAREAETRFRLALGGSRDGIWDWDVAAGKNVYYSERFRELLGQTDESLSGDLDSWTSLIHPEDKQNVLSAIVKHLHQKEPYQIECRCRYGLDEYRWYLARGQAIWNEEGRAMRMAGSLTDISEWKMAEQRLELALEAANEGLWDWNLITNETYFNDSWYTMLGYKPGELPMTLESWSKICHPDDLIGAQENIEAYLDGKTDIYMHDQRLKRKDGSWYWIRDVGKITEWSPAGQPVRMIGVHFDINELKEKEQLLIEAKDKALSANEAKSEFLANMSHEIRTPMNGVIGMTDLLLDTKLDNNQLDLAQTIKDSGRSLLTIINDILDFSKIEAGKLALAPIDFSLSRFLLEVERLHASRFSEKNIHFVHEIKGDIPDVIYGDPNRLKQVIINLVGNAIKFTPEDGAIILQVGLENRSDDDLTLLFSVLDTGIGIPKERQDAIFEAFTQADSSTTREFGGTGLGLSISSKLVKMMGGDIGLSSNPGMGTVFYFSAHFKAGSEQSIAAETEKAVSGSYKSLRVLLAEDNAVNQKLAIRILEKAGHSVEVANNGQEAVDKVDADSFDIILMDIQMPVMGGEEAVENIRARESTTKIPIIALTAHALQGDREKYLSRGMDGYVTKPLDRKKLLETMEELIGNR